MQKKNTILEKWKENQALILIIYEEEGVVNHLKGRIIDFDQNTISISSFKNFVILSRKSIIKIKGEKNDNPN